MREFASGISAEEALEQRERRMVALRAAGWAVTSQWGGFTFKGHMDEDQNETPDDNVQQDQP